MINKILQSTRGKPCSCPAGKECSGCRLKRALKPHVYLEEPRKLTVPIVISHYKYKKPPTVNKSTKSHWSFSKTKENHDPRYASQGLCNWYRKKRALHQLKIEHEKEQKRIQQEKLEKARKQREKEFLDELIKQEQYKQDLINKQQKVVLPPPTITAHVRTKKVRQGKSTSAKPKAISKHVTVKRHERYQTFSERFVNFVYRACCQFYCYLSLFIILTFVFILYI